MKSVGETTFDSNKLTSLVETDHECEKFIATLGKQYTCTEGRDLGVKFWWYLRKFKIRVNTDVYLLRYKAKFLN